MSVTLPSGSLSASKLACGGNKSRQAILPLLSAVNVTVEISHRSRTSSSPFERGPRRRSPTLLARRFQLPAFQLFASWPVEQGALGLLLSGGDFDQAVNEMGATWLGTLSIVIGLTYG
jgi:hypothetical protein